MVAIAVGLLALASFAWPRLALVLVLTAITALFVTAAIGVFHVGVEYHWWQGPQACSGNVPRGLSPEQLKKYLFGAKMVRCDEIGMGDVGHLDGRLERHPVRLVWRSCWPPAWRAG